MDSNDWYDYGAKIGELVQSAIDSNNFRSLNQSITDTINDAIESIGLGTGSKNGYQGPRSYRKRGETAYQEAKGRAGSAAADRLFAEAQRQTQSMTGRASRSLRGVASMAVGYAMAAVSGIGTLTMGFLTALTGLGLFRLLSVFLLILTVVFLIVGIRGSGKRASAKQMERYLTIIGDREMVTFEELAAASGKSAKAVRSEIKQMIQDGVFPSPIYVDEQETCIMTTRSAYQQYQQTMASYRQRRQEEKAEEAVRRQAEKDMEAYPEETQKILQEGQEFIAHIHACNDVLSGEEISTKLARLEQVVTRIFDEVAADPSSAPDLHRMMNYYLPTTRKLVDAYVDLDKKQLGGKNVTKTKQEIEASLDTINIGFEALLDSFFQDTAWDVSSDISTLKTMMARDGLTGRDFAPGEHIKTVHGDLDTEKNAAPANAPSQTPDGAAQEPAQSAHTASYGGGAAAAAPAPEGKGISLVFGEDEQAKL